MTEIYKGYTIKAKPYLDYNHSYWYEIIDKFGKVIVDTLWNDDKMWETAESAIASAKREIDNPDEGYMKMFKQQFIFK